MRVLIPVTVVTGADEGFLAAAAPTLARTAVVLHEIAADDGDSAQPALGCTCCRMRGGLTVTLLDLLRRRSRGEVPDFERVLVSAPAGEGAQVLQEIAASLALGVAFRLDALVAAGEGTDASIADRVIAGEAAADAAWLAPMAMPQALAPAGGIRAANDEAIEAFVLGWDDAQPLRAVGDWLEALAGTCGERVLRVHGTAAVEDGNVFAVNAVRHVVAPPAAVPIGGRVSRVRFVTRGLEPNDVLPPWPAGAAR